MVTKEQLKQYNEGIRYFREAIRMMGLAQEQLKSFHPAVGVTEISRFNERCNRLEAMLLGVTTYEKPDE